jgi:hypothetical protein
MKFILNIGSPYFSGDNFEKRFFQILAALILGEPILNEDYPEYWLP